MRFRSPASAGPDQSRPPPADPAAARGPDITGIDDGPGRGIHGPRSAPDRSSPPADRLDGIVTLTTIRPFAIAKPVRFPNNGQPPAGLQDGSGRLIDDDHNGTPGGDAVATLSRRGASIEAIASGTTGGRDAGIMAIVDALFEQDALAGLTTGPGYRLAKRSATTRTEATIILATRHAMCSRRHVSS